jgi:hypothetical protein
MDLNGDGKHDWQDDYLTQKMIDGDSSDKNSMPGGHITDHGTPLGVIIFIIVAILCFSALCMGYPGAIGSLIGIGIVVYFIAKWLFN